MSTELERQLRAGFGRLPKPTREASARARAAALDALGPHRRRSRGGLLLVSFAVAFVIGAGAAALAATGNLHVRLGAGERPKRPVPTRLSVPAGSHGVAVVAGGKLWLATRSGLRIEGMPVSAAELSPRALYAVVGIGSSLVTLAPGNRRPWVHQTDGRVVSAAWSPDGLKIVYVVARRGADELRLIEGDGSPDRLLVRRVRPVRPSWRADSLAVAYVDAHGRAAVFDLSSGLRRTFDTRRCGGAAREVAYDRRAPVLAVVSAHGIAVVRRWNRPASCATLDVSASPLAAGWLQSGQVVLAVNRPLGGSLERLSGTNLNEAGAAFGRQRLRGLAAAPKGSSVAVALRRSAGVVDIGLVSSPERGARLKLSRPLLRLRTTAGAVSISWR
ncbi:MAG: hypothetical protein AUH17_07535 [Actinobacteria bacterium 13_2_20CM_68_14]|jgi:hypothetical protein|nr:MAG: hypothetical protein AUH17_07535 [Actinobacteria bacterium 13_2_20CM_68_14]